jgi:hypothetical protein
MDPEAKRMLEEMYALAKDSHRLLRAVRRHQILDTFGKWILWLILIGASVVSYFFYLQPFVDQLRIPGLQAMQASGLDSSTTTPLGKLINYFKAGK